VFLWMFSILFRLGKGYYIHTYTKIYILEVGR